MSDAPKTTKAMNRKQLTAAMAEAGIEGEITGRGTNLEVEVKDEETSNFFWEKVAQWGGYRTGYGSWILRPGYQDRGDWNDRSSSWHY